MNGRLDGGPCEWLVGKLQGPENKHWPKWSRKCKSNKKNGGGGGSLRHVWEVTSLKSQNGKKLQEMEEKALDGCPSTTPRCDCM